MNELKVIRVSTDYSIKSIHGDHKGGFMLLKGYVERKMTERKIIKRRRRRKIFSAFAIGSILSAISALLFAPKSGKELRKDISEKANESIKYAKDKGTKLTDKTGQLVHSGIDESKHLYQKVSNKIANTFSSNKLEEIKEETNQVVEKKQKVTDKTEEKLKEAANEVKEKIK